MAAEQGGRFRHAFPHAAIEPPDADHRLHAGGIDARNGGMNGTHLAGIDLDLGAVGLGERDTFVRLALTDLSPSDFPIATI